MGVKVTGLPMVMASIRHKVERVADGARKVMHRAADEIVKEAKLNAPVDTQALEDSIHKEISYGGRGRLQIDVVAGEGTNPKTGAPVETYAAEIHENYENIPGAPGPKTEEKQRANPDRHVGSKYLENAVEKVAPKLRERFIEAKSEALR